MRLRLRAVIDPKVSWCTVLFFASEFLTKRLGAGDGTLDVDHSRQSLVGDRVGQQRVAAIREIDGHRTCHTRLAEFRVYKTTAHGLVDNDFGG